MAGMRVACGRVCNAAESDLFSAVKPHVTDTTFTVPKRPTELSRNGRSEERTGARSEERGGCIAPPNATNFGEKVERGVLDSLSSVAPAPGVGAARATPSRAAACQIWVFELHRVTSSYRNRMEPPVTNRVTSS